MMRGESLCIEPCREERGPLCDARWIALANTEPVSDTCQNMQFRGASVFPERKEELRQPERNRRIVVLAAKEKGRRRVWRQHEVAWNRGIDERHEIRPGALCVDGIGRIANSGIELRAGKGR